MYARFPEQLQSHSENWLEPFTFSSIVPLLMVRFQLYRQNINIHATVQERGEAVERCLSVAYDTVRYLARIMRTPPSSPYRASLGHDHQTWQQMLDAIAHNLLCRHMWRCTLILSLRGDLGAASTCVRFLKAIGTARKLNVACGRNIAFFLHQIIGRVSAGMPQHELEADLEMLTYASGDLQGDLESLAWTGGRFSSREGEPASNLASFEEEGLPSSALLTEKEMNDWGGWEHVERQISRLSDEQQKRQYQYQRSPYQQPTSAQQYPTYHRPAHNETKRLQLGSANETPSPSTATSSGAAPPKSTPPAGASRISIANII